MRDDLPTGTVTFLFTDVEGSTKLLHELGAEAYGEALAEHRGIVREACAAEGGVEVDTQGDAFFFAFASAPGAVAAARAMTEALAPGRIHVRIGLHTGTPVVTDEGYVGADVHRAARIAAAGHGGQVLLAATTASLVVSEGLVDLGEHRFKDLAAPERVYQLGTGEFLPLESLFRSNLPLAANPLVGRKKELADVLRALLDGARAVTITGPGGVGKTRLALAVAGEAADAFPDGIWFVPLAPLRDPALVLPTVADVIGADGDLARHIGDDRSLLFLDNVEHVVDAAPALAALVAECPRLRLMATSREALRIAVEREYPLSPLPEAPSVELFRQRASAVAPDVEIEYAIAAEMCDRLDRLPLAIELAAARCKALSPAQVLERLTDLLDLLKGARDADPRQQTLRATIEWSFRLLVPEEQQLFGRLSVFRGGCALEAAEAVCDADLDTLHSLVEKSLIRFTDGRYWMLETIREYARERLVETGKRGDHDLRHAHYFLARLEQAYEERTGPLRSEVFAWYAAEVDNLRAMLDRLTESAPEEVPRATHMLFRFWKSLGALEEATLRLDSLLPLQLTDDLRAETLASLAEIQEARGDLDGARATAAEALRLSAPGTIARIIALGITATSEALRGNVDEAIRLGRQEVEDAPPDPSAQIATRGDLAMLLVQVGRRAEARTVLHDAIGEARQHGLSINERWGTGQLGFIDVLDADYQSARAALTSALSYARSVGHYPYEVFMLEWLGFAYVGTGDRRAARATFGEMLELATSRSGRTITPEIAIALDGLALTVDAADLREGARLGGAVAKMRDEAGGLRSNLWPQEKEIVARFEQPLADALGREAYESARAAGAALGLDETLELARSLAAS